MPESVAAPPLHPLPVPGPNPAVPAGPAFSREVRLGLVMYGGVSLAIYINGVAREFFEAVRGRGVYSLIKALTDSDIIVDIISGTSAGGINGIFLATALCNQCEFSPLADLWREHGDISRLLRSPREKNPASLLDSEGYYQGRLEAAFLQMEKARIKSKPGELVSELKELDLFVTGTDVHGAISTRFDSAGHPITVKDHRSVFQLKFRRGRKNELAPGPGFDWATQATALAKLARITSCFPVAFAPPCVDPHGPSPDRLISRWGLLHRPTFFLDGGVLDNKPFTHTLWEIFHRSADREVARLMLYVEPDPEVFHEPEKVRQPNLLQAGLEATVGIPGYESIADDLKLVTERNDRIRQFKDLTARCEEAAQEYTPHARAEFDRIFRSGDSLEQALSLIAEPARSLYYKARLVSLRTPAVRGLLRRSRTDEYLDPMQQKGAARLVRGFDNWKGDGYETLHNFDLPFRKRRLFRVIYAVYDQLHPSANNPTPNTAEPASPPLTAERRQVYAAIWARCNSYLERLDIIRHAIYDLMDRAPINIGEERFADEIWQTLKACLEQLLHRQDPGGVPLDELGLADLHTTLQRRVAAIVAQVGAGQLRSPSAFDNLLLQLEAEERTLLAQLPRLQNGAPDPVYLAYSDFLMVDAALFPLQLSSGVQEKDVIRTYRISPLDASAGFSDRSVREKVAGDQLAHFSGFFKRSWRSNDILFGRLDATAQLIEQTFTEERVRAIAADLAGRRAATYFRGNWQQGLRDQLPFVPAAVVNQLIAWVEKILLGDPQALQPAEFARQRELLIKVAQFQILEEELPVVLKDAIQEQHEWRNMNPTVASLASLAEAEKTVERLKEPRPAASDLLETPLGKYFRKDYKVGQESIRDNIPHLVLLETLTAAMLVLKNAVVGLLGDKAAQVRAHPIYRFGLHYPLWVFHGMIRFLRRAPQFEKALIVGAAILSMILLAIGITWRNEILCDPSPGSGPSLWCGEGTLELKWVTVFLVLPGVILLLETLLFLRTVVGMLATGVVSVAALAAGAYWRHELLVTPNGLPSVPWILTLVVVPPLLLFLDVRATRRWLRRRKTGKASA